MFNPEEHKTKVKPFTDKLILSLKTKGIEVTLNSDEFKNILLKSKDKEFKMSEHSFYGYSRMGANTKQRGEKTNEFEFVPVTHEFYITSVLRSVIDFVFNPPVKK